MDVGCWVKEWTVFGKAPGEGGEEGRNSVFFRSFLGSDSCFGMQIDEITDLPRLEDLVFCQRMTG